MTRGGLNTTYSVDYSQWPRRSYIYRIPALEGTAQQTVKSGGPRSPELRYSTPTPLLVTGPESGEVSTRYSRHLVMWARVEFCEQGANFFGIEPRTLNILAGVFFSMGDEDLNLRTNNILSAKSVLLYSIVFCIITYHVADSLHSTLDALLPLGVK